MNGKRFAFPSALTNAIAVIALVARDTSSP